MLLMRKHLVKDPTVLGSCRRLEGDAICLISCHTKKLSIQRRIPVLYKSSKVVLEKLPSPTMYKTNGRRLRHMCFLTH